MRAAVPLALSFAPGPVPKSMGHDDDHVLRLPRRHRDDVP
jgi:hypothetical protein